MAHFYRANLLLYFMIVVEILKECLTEVFTRKSGCQYVDFLWELVDGSLFHLEFQFHPTSVDDLKRFYGYNQAKSVETMRNMVTMVINFARRESCIGKIWINETILFKPIMAFLGGLILKND